jgi:hypothetical protein
MKTVEEPTESTALKVTSTDRPTGGADAPTAPHNEDRTDTGDPLALQYNKGDLHNHPGHITGSGGGPPFRTHRRGGAPWDVLVQDYIRFSAKAANTPVTAPTTAPAASPPVPSANSVLFDENGVPKNHLPFNPREWNLPETQAHRTFPYLIANKGSEMLLNNPATRFANKGPWQGALAGAATLGGIGLLGTGAYNAFRGFRGEAEQKLPFWKTVLLTSLVGAGLGAFSGWQRRKNHPQSPPNIAARKDFMEKRQSLVVKEAFSYGGGDAQAMIQSLQGSGLPFSVLERIVNFLVGLAPADARALRQMTGGIGGAALGVFLAKKLGLGSLLTAGLGLAGAGAGFRMLGGEMPRRQRMTDLYGTPF